MLATARGGGPSDSGPPRFVSGTPRREAGPRKRGGCCGAVRSSWPGARAGQAGADWWRRGRGDPPRGSPNHHNPDRNSYRDWRPALVSAKASFIALGGPIALAAGAHGWSVCGGGTDHVDHEAGAARRAFSRIREPARQAVVRRTPLVPAAARARWRILPAPSRSCRRRERSRRRDAETRPLSAASADPTRPSRVWPRSLDGGIAVSVVDGPRRARRNTWQRTGGEPLASAHRGLNPGTVTT
jgi:hypothetical protein